jgi:hypothetical protein
MSYFSPRASWISLVGSPGSFSFKPDSSPAMVSLAGAMSRLGNDWDGKDGENPADLKALQNQRDLRHRLFFHHREWEFGPALLEDDIRLARAQSSPSIAVAHYEEARLVAKTLAEDYGEESFVPAWLEINRVLAEIYSLTEQGDKSVFYAREGLQVLRGVRFDSSLDPFITKLTLRFWDLLGRIPV